MPTATRPSSVRFGVFLPQIYPWEAYLGHARLVESLGFESLWLADQFAHPFDPPADWLEGWTLLGALAAATETIRLGPLVSHVIYRNPAVLARQIMTLDRISGGRAVVALGAGGTDADFQMTGVPAQAPRVLADRLVEAAELIDRLLRHRVASYEGRYFRAEEAQMGPGPVQQPRPPLTIAAHGPRTLRLAARLGDAWNFYWAGRDATAQRCLELTRERNTMVTEFAQEAGRDPRTIRRSFATGYTADEPFASLEAFRDFIGRYREAGIDEFILGYGPGGGEQAGRLFTRDRWIVTPEMLEAVAGEIAAMQTGGA